MKVWIANNRFGSVMILAIIIAGIVSITLVSMGIWQGLSGIFPEL